MRSCQVCSDEGVSVDERGGEGRQLAIDVSFGGKKSLCLREGEKRKTNVGLSDMVVFLLGIFERALWLSGCWFLGLKWFFLLN